MFRALEPLEKRRLKKKKRENSSDRTNDYRACACILRVHPKSRPMASSRTRNRGGRFKEKAKKKREEERIGAKATVTSTSCATRRGSYGTPRNWGPAVPTVRRWGRPYVRPWERPGPAHPASEQPRVRIRVHLPDRWFPIIIAFG